MQSPLLEGWLPPRDGAFPRNAGKPGGWLAWTLKKNACNVRFSQISWHNPSVSVVGCIKSSDMSTEHTLDKLDRSILRRLQENGRETYDVIGEQVGLSPSAVLRRVKRLEEAGVIERYVALVPPEKVGLGLTAYLNVRLEKSTEIHKRNPMDAFKQSVQNWPEVVECASLTGDMDYLLRVVVSDMQHYSRFIMETLLKHPSVADCKTSFVLDRVKATTSVPV